MMTDAAIETVDPKAVRRASLVRLATGLAQGLLLYGLYEAGERKAWPAIHPMLFAAIGLAVLYAPFVVLAGASSLRLRTLAVWKLGAVIVAAGLSAYDIWVATYYRHAGDYTRILPDPPVFCAIAAVLFIGHHLVQPADMERRPIARFATYFDVTWKHGVQLVLSLLFTGAFWLLLFLAAQLFKLIGIDAIQRLIEQEFFSFPATTVVFAAAVQLTDVRANLVRGVRTVSLTLLAWLLPLMALIAGGFLASLPFTGLAPLWATKAAAALLLVAAAFLIVLTNAAYQDGSERPAAVLAWAARAAGLLLAPITALAAYAVWLRVTQYGLTPERVIAAACVVVAAGYAIGYATAALRRGAWMKSLETTNIAMAFVAVGLLLALFSPVADPRRLSVGDQVRRLERGAVKAEAFDFLFLRFDSARFGREALDRLKANADPVVARRAREAGAMKERPYLRDPKPEPAARPPRITYYPKGEVPPKGFAEAMRSMGSDSNCLQAGATCEARLVDVTGDGAPEVLMTNRWALEVFSQSPTDGWRKIGVYTTPCEGFDFTAAVREGALEATVPAVRDLAGPSGTLRFLPELKTCPPKIEPVQKP